MANPIITSSKLEKPRQRLFRKYRHLRSWHKLADILGVNVAYVYEYAVHGKEPGNPEIRKALGIRYHRRTINDHLAHDDLQDMPLPLLTWAFENREEI